MEPQQILGKLLSEDSGEALRQVAILDGQGRVAVHTGSRCVSAAGHAIGANCCAQGNMMMGDTVWSAMVGAFQNASGELADRLLAAMEAAENEGGDLRGKQAASLIVVPGEASGVPQLDRSIDLRVDDHTEPVGEIRRLLSYSRAHERANHATEKAMANELPSALAELDTCCAAHPNEPEFLFRRGLVLLMLGQTNQAQEALQRAHAIHPGWSELLLRFADAGIIPVQREMLKPLVPSLHSEDLSGASNPG